MKKSIQGHLIIFFFLFLSISSPTLAKTYYISASGNDSNNGLTPATAWQSIAKLNTYFNIIVAGDSILFKSGESFYGSIEVGQSGTKSLPIVFSSFGTGDKPVITGFTSLTNWTNTGDNIWKTNIENADSKLILVSINNQLQRMGRYPNYAFETGGYLFYENINTSAPSITDNQLPASPNWTGADAVIRKYTYVSDVCPITSHNQGTLTYSMAMGKYGAITTSYGTKGFGYFIQNDIRTLDQFGEWFFDEKTKDLYVYFGTNDPSLFTVKASTIDFLIDCGGGGFGLPSSIIYTNICVKNLFLEGASKTGFFSFNGENMTVQNCTFNNNASAIYMWNVPNSLSDNNIITNTLNIGIEQQGRISSPTIVTNNTIKNCGLFDGMGGSGGANYSGIITSGNNTTIQNNILDSIGFNGIDSKGGNLLIKNNFIKNYNLVLDDGSGIYIFADRNKNKVIESNIVINGPGKGLGRSINTEAVIEGIYLDGASRYATINNNTISQPGGKGIYVNTGNDIIISNNTMYNVREAIRINRYAYPTDPPCRNNTISSNICYPTQSNFAYWNGQLNNPVPIDIKTDIRLVGTFDNNFYRNNVAEPFNYQYHITLYGTFVNPPSLNFSQWQTFINDDANSQLLSRTENVFEYNPTPNPIEYNFPGLSKKNVFGETFINSYTIPPFSSIILWDASIVMPPKVGTIIQPSSTVATGSVILNGLPETGTWTLTGTPEGITITGTGPSFTITGLSPSTYTFTVTHETSGNTSESSGNVVILSQPSAPTIGLITQPSCNVETGMVELFGLPGGTWTLTRNPGEISTTGTGNWTTIKGLFPGTYTFLVTNSIDITSIESTEVIIDPQPIPPVAIITQNGDVLHSNALYNNQWYNQNGIIIGANNQDYKVTSPGDYYVIVEDNNGCISEPSNIIHVIPTGIEINEFNKTISVYPNPVSDELIIEISGNKKNIGFEILNLVNLIIIKGQIMDKTIINTSNFSPGIYIIKLDDCENYKFTKFVKK